MAPSVKSCIWFTLMIWNSRSYGRPTAASLTRLRNKLKEPENGIMTGHLRIVEQKTGRIVATYKAPAFEVVEPARKKTT